MLKNNNLSKKTIILGVIAFWLFGYAITVIILFWQINFDVVWLKDTFLGLLSRPFLVVLMVIYSPLYVLPLLLVGYLSKRWREKKKLHYGLLTLILPIFLSLLIAFPFFSMLALAHGVAAEMKTSCMALAIQLTFCLILSIIFNYKKEKIIPKLTLISLIFFLGGATYITVSAKVASHTGPILERLSQEAVEAKDVSLCEQILEESKKRKVYSGNPGSLCQAYYAECVADIALILGDVSLCKKLGTLNEMECEQKVLPKIFLKTTNLCKDILEEEEKINCLQQVAIETNNLELCKKIFTGGSKCLGAIAAKTNNFNLCSITKIGEMVGSPLPKEFNPKECFQEVFRYLNLTNPEICDKAEIEDKSSCITAAAIYLDDPKLCDKITHELGKKWCLDDYTRYKRK